MWQNNSSQCIPSRFRSPFFQHISISTRTNHLVFYIHRKNHILNHLSFTTQVLFKLNKQIHATSHCFSYPCNLFSLLLPAFIYIFYPDRPQMCFRFDYGKKKRKQCSLWQQIFFFCYSVRTSLSVPPLPPVGKQAAKTAKIEFSYAIDGTHCRIFSHSSLVFRSTPDFHLNHHV